MSNDEALAFGVRGLGVAAAQLACDAYMESKLSFARAPKKSEERGGRAIDIQRNKRDMDEAVRVNRSRFKLILGDKK